MAKINCAVINCSDSTYKLNKWQQEICYEHNSSKQEECIHCIPPFKLQCFPCILRNKELRNKWISALKRQNKDKVEWKSSANARFFSIHFIDSAYGVNSVPTLNLGYIAKEKRLRQTLIKQTLPKKSKIKENDVNDDDYVVPLPVFTTESQPAATCSTT